MDVFVSADLSPGQTYARSSMRLGPSTAAKCSKWSRSLPDEFPAPPIASRGPVGAKQCQQRQQLPAAPPLPTYRSTVAPTLTQLAGHAGRRDRGGSAGVAARRFFIARPLQRISAPRTTRRCGPPALSSGFVACLRLSATGRAAALAGQRGDHRRIRAEAEPSAVRVCDACDGQPCGQAPEPASRSWGGGLLQQCPAMRGMCAILRFGARLAFRLQPGNLRRFQQILGGAPARQAARRPNLPSRPPAQSVQQTAILVPQAPPAARRRRRPGHGLPPAAGPRQEARPVCSKPHHRACGRMGPRRMAGLCAGNGSRQAQRKNARMQPCALQVREKIRL